MKVCAYYFSLIILIACSGCALSSDVVYLDDRIDAIERKYSKQNTSSSSSYKNLRKEYARLSNEIDRLDEQIRMNEGRFEEVDYSREKQNKANADLKLEIERLDSIAAELANRIRYLETYVGYEPAEGGAVKPPTVKPSGKPAKPESLSKDLILYNSAKKSFDSNNMKDARKGFGDLLNKYPKSPNADNAQFWIGESYYREKWYQKAILEYQKVIENYPKGNKVAAAYLKQGLAFSELGEKDNSRLILKELLKKYPNAGEATLARKKLESLK